MSNPTANTITDTPAGGWNRIIRRFNRAVLNPLLLGVADRVHGTYPAVAHHIGRASGRAYRTPVVAQPVPGGFVIPLPYGVDTDWCQNVLAAGRFTIERAGQTFVVEDPRVIEAVEALPLVTERARRAWQRFRVDNFLRVKVLEHATAADAAASVDSSGR